MFGRPAFHPWNDGSIEVLGKTDSPLLHVADSSTEMIPMAPEGKMALLGEQHFSGRSASPSQAPPLPSLRSQARLSLWWRSPQPPQKEPISPVARQHFTATLHTNSLSPLLQPCTGHSPYYFLLKCTNVRTKYFPSFKWNSLIKTGETSFYNQQYYAAEFMVHFHHEPLYSQRVQLRFTHWGCHQTWNMLLSAKWHRSALLQAPAPR